MSRCECCAVPIAMSNWLSGEVYDRRSALDQFEAEDSYLKARRKLDALIEEASPCACEAERDHYKAVIDGLEAWLESKGSLHEGWYGETGDRFSGVQAAICADAIAELRRLLAEEAGQ